MTDLSNIIFCFLYFFLFFYACIFVNYLFKTLHYFCSCSALANFRNCIFNKYLYLLELLFWIWLWKWIWKRTGGQGKKHIFNSFLKRTIIFISKKTTSFFEKTIYLCFILILKKNFFIIFIFKKTYFILKDMLLFRLSINSNIQHYSTTVQLYNYTLNDKKIKLLAATGN